MHLWCENCCEKTQTLADKYDISICNQCGCEVRGMHDHLIAMQTQGLLEDAGCLDENEGFVGLPLNSDVNLTIEQGKGIPEEILSTAKYLPEDFYEEESSLAEAVAALDEAWPEDELMEKIQRLEDSLRPSTKLPSHAQTTASLEPDESQVAKPISPKQIRVDMGHVASQREIARENPNGTKVFSKQETLEAKPLPIARKLGDLKEVRIDSVDIPVGQPSKDSAGQVTSQVTSLGLVAAWSVQLLVGIAFAPTLPTMVWGVWLFAQVVGSLCLCAVLFHMFAGEPEAIPYRKVPRAPIGSNASRSSKLFQD